MTLSLVLASLAATLGCLVLHLLFPGKARAWDPNSHDKLTNFALDLLAEHPRKTLLGWVLAACRPDNGNDASTSEKPAFPLRLAIEMQTRRGAVEEDMHSFLISRRPFIEANVDTLEGANGGYHFYCPKRPEGYGRGLTDASFFLWLIGAKGSGCTPPMPSALVRATSRELGRYDLGAENNNWHLDTENRNYTFDDALDYYRKGYSHLAFYTIGRVCHLLQDMAVPAHVRDDAHVGGIVQSFGFDPSDPLERYAEAKDVPSPFNSAHIFNNFYHELWSFKPNRHYIHDAVFTNALDNFERQNKSITQYFHDLALQTFNTCYSFNTIPQNIDSHDPIDPRGMPFLSTKNVPAPQRLGGTEINDSEKFGSYLAQNLEVMTVSVVPPPPYLHPIDAGEMGRRCDIETDALWYMLERLADYAKILYDPGRIPPTVVLPGFSGMRDVTAVSDALTQLGQRSTGSDASEGRPVDTLGIIGIGCRLTPLPHAKTADLLDTVHGWSKDAEKVLEQVTALEAQTGVAPDVTYVEAALALVEYADEAKPDRLAELLRDSPGQSLSSLLTSWIFESGLTFKTLRKWFVVPIIPIEEDIPSFLPAQKVKDFLRELGACHYQGPFCLTESIIARQYLQQQEAAVGQTADMLATWFDSLFTEAFPLLDVWLNANAPTLEDTPVLAPIQAIKTQHSAQKWATLALFDHLPIPLDVRVEISLDEEETDKELLEKGVNLAVSWDLVLGQGVKGGGETAGTYVTEAVQSFLETAPCQLLSADYSIDLGGKYGSSVTLEHSLIPYNLETLLRVVLPTGLWNPQGTSMGGIRREGEPTAIFPLEHTRRDDPNNARITTSMLRIRPVGPADAPTPGAP